MGIPQMTNMIASDCPRCSGSGDVKGEWCWKCNGTGEIEIEDTKPSRIEELADDIEIERIAKAMGTIVPKKRGRPFGSTNKPKEKENAVPEVSNAQPSWWTPIPRTGAGVATVRFIKNGKISISLSALRLIGLSRQNKGRFRIGNMGRDTIIIQAFNPDDPKQFVSDFPWELNADLSLRTRPIEMLDAIGWDRDVRYRAVPDLENKTLTIERNNRLR